MNALIRTIGLSAKFVENTYDRAGFNLMQAMMDNTFMDIDHTKLKSPHLKKAATIYNGANNLAQEKFYKSVAETFASGNVGPKPDFKKPLLTLGNIVLTNLPRMSVSQTMVIALSVGIGLVAIHLQTPVANIMHDTIDTYRGFKSGTEAAPRLEA